jgi:tripeptide aminopeptidase
MAAVNAQRLKHLFLELVQIDSLSRHESACAARLRRELEALGASCRFDGAGARVGGEVGNLIAHVAGNKPGVPPLLLSAHMDTVAPGEGVRPVVEGDIIRSDGRTVLGGDDKSGIAIICEVIHRLHEAHIPHGPIDVVFTICEEIGLQGARHLDLSLVTAREGLVFDSDAPGCLFVRGPASQSLEFTVHGLEAHAGMAPERGLSAIKIAGEAIAAMRLGRIDDETTANLGIINGGRALNVVPNRVTVRGEARSRNAAKLTAQVEHMAECFRQAVARHRVTLDGRLFTARFDYRADTQYQAMNVSEDAPIVTKVVEAARRTGREVKPESCGGGCDANIFNHRGLVVANLGTGMRDIHTVREWVNIQDMIGTAEVTLELVQLQAGG